MEKNTSDQVINLIQAMKKIVDDYLSTISDSVKPEKLEYIIDQLVKLHNGGRASILYVNKKLLDNIRIYGRTSNSESLYCMSRQNLDTLEQLEIELHSNLEVQFPKIGINSEDSHIYSPTHRRYLELQQVLLETLQEIKETIEDIAGQSYGFTGRSRNLSTSCPIEFQIPTVYHLRQILDIFESKYTQLLKFPVPDSVIPAFLQLENRLKSNRIDITVQQYLNKANDRMLQKDYPTSCHNLRQALEEAVIKIAHLIKKDTSNMKYQDALNFLAAKLKIPQDVIRTIMEKDSGLYGWLSIKGSHSQGVVSVIEAKHKYEAQFAMNWTTAVITMLVDAYENNKNNII